VIRAKLRAERKAGELLAQMEKAKGAPGPGRGEKAGHATRPAFTDAPLRQTEKAKPGGKNQHQDVSAIRHILTTNGIINAAFPPKPRPVSDEARRCRCGDEASWPQFPVRHARACARDPKWEKSPHIKESVWAGAPTLEKARELVDLKTLTFTPARPPRLIVYSPWLDDQLTTCDLDTARTVSEGEVIRANGKPVWRRLSPARRLVAQAIGNRGLKAGSSSTARPVPSVSDRRL
jgi:hypothetical protein